MPLKRQNIHLFTIVYVAKSLRHNIIPSCSINFYPLEVSVRCISDSCSGDSTLLVFAQNFLLVSMIRSQQQIAISTSEMQFGKSCALGLFSRDIYVVVFSVGVDVGVGIA